MNKIGSKVLDNTKALLSSVESLVDSKKSCKCISNYYELFLQEADILRYL